jgi:hypothetical protein
VFSGKIVSRKSEQKKKGEKEKNGEDGDGSARASYFVK